MNDVIVKPITPDGDVGFDEAGQLLHRTHEGEGAYKCTTIRFIRDVRPFSCIICGRGWENTAASLKDQIEISQGAPYADRRYVHYTCERGSLRREECRFWYRVASALSKTGHGFTEVANRYGGAWNNPWYQVKFNDIPDVVFTVGSRKRVYEISVVSTEGEFNPVLLAALKLFFVKEDVTKSFTEKLVYVHAWADDEASAYVAGIVRLLRESGSLTP